MNQVEKIVEAFDELKASAANRISLRKKDI